MHAPLITAPSHWPVWEGVTNGREREREAELADTGSSQYPKEPVHLLSHTHIHV